MPAQPVPSAHVPAMARDLPRIRPSFPPVLDRVRKEELVLQVLVDREVNPHARAVYAVLAHLYNLKTGYAYPNQTTIARMTGGTRESVNKALALLERRHHIKSYGWAEVPPEERGGKKKGRFYRLIDTGYVCPIHDRLASECDGEGVEMDTHEAATGVRMDTVAEVVMHPNRVEPDTSIRVETDTQNLIEEPRSTTPSSEGSTNPPRPDAAAPKANKTKALFDRCDELGVRRPTMRPQDHKALKDSDATGELVAEAWAAAWRGEWRDDWVARSRNVRTILDKIDVYLHWRDRGATASRRRNDPDGRPEVYDDYDQFRSDKKRGRQ